VATERIRSQSIAGEYQGWGWVASDWWAFYGVLQFSFHNGKFQFMLELAPHYTVM
jgi:hypothetical protein